MNQAAHQELPGPAGSPLAHPHQLLLLPLFGTLFDDLTGYLALLSALPGPTPSLTPGPTPGPTKPPAGSGRWRSPRAAYFRYPARAEEALGWARREAGAGREVHLCPHLLTRRRRVKRNAAKVATLWADADGAQLPEGFPHPTVAVRSSPGRRHLYWALRRQLAPGEAGRLNRRLTRTIGADPGGWALASLLRLPGTHNHKYPARPPVRIVAFDPDLRYHPREVGQYLAAEEDEPAPASRPGQTGLPGGLLTVDDLDRLSGRMRALISLGNEAAGKPYRSRSEADFAVAVAMVGAGFSEEAIYAVLSDPANGISAKYREKGRHAPRYLRMTVDEARRRAEPAFGSRNNVA